MSVSPYLRFVKRAVNIGGITIYTVKNWYLHSRLYFPARFLHAYPLCTFLLTPQLYSTTLLTITAAHDLSNSLTPGASRSTKSQCPAPPDPLNSIPKSFALCEAALISSADWNELGARTKTWLLLGLIVTTNKSSASAVIWACISLLNHLLSSADPLKWPMLSRRLWREALPPIITATPCRYPPKLLSSLSNGSFRTRGHAASLL